MPMRKSTILFLMAAAVVARGEYLAHGQGADSRPAAIQDPEAYAVYASLIAQEWTVTAARPCFGVSRDSQRWSSLPLKREPFLQLQRQIRG